MLSSYKIRIFRSAVDNINVLQSSCEVPDIFVWLCGGVDKELDRKEHVININKCTVLL